MAIIKISELPTVETLEPTDALPVVQNQQTKQASIAQVLAMVPEPEGLPDLPPGATLQVTDAVAVVQNGAAALTTVANILALIPPPPAPPAVNVPASRTAFVDALGNDSTGAIGNAALPYKTAQAAYNALLALTPTNTARAALVLGVGSFTITLAADWNQYVFVKGVGAAWSGLTIYAQGSQGSQGADNYWDETGQSGGNGGNGGKGRSVALSSDKTVALTIHALGGGAGSGGSSNQAMGGVGGNGGEGGNITLTDCVFQTLRAEGSPGGYGGYSNAGQDGDGGNGGGGGTVVLTRCIGGTVSVTGGSYGQAGSMYNSYGYPGAGGNGGTITLNECEGVTVNAGNGQTGYYNSTQMALGSQTFLNCKKCTLSLTTYSENGNLIVGKTTIKNCVDASVQLYQGSSSSWNYFNEVEITGSSLVLQVSLNGFSGNKNISFVGCQIGASNIYINGGMGSGRIQFTDCLFTGAGDYGLGSYTAGIYINYAACRFPLSLYQALLNSYSSYLYFIGKDGTQVSLPESTNIAYII